MTENKIKLTFRLPTRRVQSNASPRAGIGTRRATSGRGRPGFHTGTLLAAGTRPPPSLSPPAGERSCTCGLSTCQNGTGTPELWGTGMLVSREGGHVTMRRKMGREQCCGFCFYSRCFEPILLLHYPPHLIEGLALVLVKAKDRRPVLEPLFGHLRYFKVPGFHARSAWSPVLGSSCGPAWGRPARAT